MEKNEVKTEVKTEVTSEVQPDLSKSLSDEIRKGVDKKEIEYSRKEQKAIRNFNIEKYKNCPKVFLIKNKKNGRVVEIRAPSVVLASTAVGWRPRHTVLLEERVEIKQEQKEEK